MQHRPCSVSCPAVHAGSSACTSPLLYLIPALRSVAACHADACSVPPREAGSLGAPRVTPFPEGMLRRVHEEHSSSGNGEGEFWRTSPRDRMVPNSFPSILLLCTTPLYDDSLPRMCAPLWREDSIPASVSEFTARGRIQWHIAVVRQQADADLSAGTCCRSWVSVVRHPSAPSAPRSAQRRAAAENEPKLGGRPLRTAPQQLHQRRRR